MNRVLLVVLLVFIVIASAVGLIALFPFMKEGSSWSDMPIFAGVIGGALLLGWVWWLAVDRSPRKALVGWAVLALPLIGHGLVVISLIGARFEGQRLETSIAIENYREMPIVWPGFDGPVGLELSFDLHHATGQTALILPPEIRMGPKLDIPRDVLSASRTSGSGYLKNYYLREPAGDLTLLKTVLFQRVFENPKPEKPYYKWTAAVHFAASDKTALTYFLLPGTVDYVPDQGRICLDSRSYGIAVCAKDEKPDSGCASPNHQRDTEPIYFTGDDLSANWMAAGASDMTADLSGQITATLRQRSGLQSNPADWRAIQKRLEPEGLAAAGYRTCPAGKDSHTSFRICYCRDS